VSRVAEVTSRSPAAIGPFSAVTLVGMTPMTPSGTALDRSSSLPRRESRCRLGRDHAGDPGRCRLGALLDPDLPAPCDDQDVAGLVVADVALDGERLGDVDAPPVKNAPSTRTLPMLSP